MKKSIISLLFVLVLSVSLLSFAAMAKEPDDLDTAMEITEGIDDIEAEPVLDGATGITSFAALQAVIDAVPADGGEWHITLTDNLYGGGDASNAITIPGGSNIVLDLAGHTMDLGLTKDSEGKASVITVYGSLMLIDSSAAKTGTVTGGYANEGGGVYVYGGSFTMVGGTISGCSAHDGGGVFVFLMSSFTMSGGSIEGCTASGHGGGVYDYGAFTMRGAGSIKNCTASVAGGVCLDDELCTFTMSGGSIEGCTASSYGGVYARAGRFTMTGGSVTGCSAASVGGGVFVSSNMTMTVGGSARITANSCGDKASNLCLGNASLLLSADVPLTGDAAIGLTTSKTLTWDNPITVIASGVTDSIAACFSSDKSECVLSVSDGKLLLGKDATGLVIINAANFPDNNFRAYVSANCDTNTDGALSAAEIAAVTELKLGSKSISNLTGLGLFANLVTLECYSNGLTALDLSGLTKLETLNCNSNALTELKVSDLPSLTFIDCAFNRLTRLDISGTALPCAQSDQTAIGFQHADGGDTYTTITVKMTEAQKTAFLQNCKQEGDGVEAVTDWPTAKITTFAELQAAIDAAPTDGTATKLTLAGNLDGEGDVDNAITISGGRNIVLDLAGYTMDLAMEETGASLIKVSGETTKLTLEDSSEDGTGTITGGWAEERGGAVYVDGGTFKMSGGTITGCKADDYGGGIYLSDGSLTLSGGAVKDCSAQYGGGVYVSGGAFTMDGGSIVGCSAQYGGGVFIFDDEFTMAGGIITGCKADDYGGGVYVFSDSSFTMTGGTITSCTASSSGGGVYVISYGAVVLGGTAQITDNTSDNLFRNENATLSLSSETPLTSGADIGITSSSTPTADTPVVLMASGASEDSLNYLSADNADYTLSIKDGQLLLVIKTYTVTYDANGGENAPDAQVKMPGVSLTLTSDKPTREEYIFFGWAATADAAGAEHGAGGSYTADADVTFYAVWRPAAITSFADLQASINAAPPDGTETLITLTQDLDGEGLDDNALIVSGGRNITLDLAGYTLDLGLTEVSSAIFTVTGGALTVTDSSEEGTGIITGGMGLNGGGFYLNGGSLTLSGGAIRDCSAQYGGAVYVKTGTFTMDGSSIESGTASSNGGGVYMAGGTFNMSSGSITGCSAPSNGGVYVSGTFNMSGGSIEDCTAYYGGGVYVSNNSTLNMTGGSITGCTASYGGGGVYVSNGTFTMTGGSITGCTASFGGGVYAHGTFTMNGGCITGCLAKFGGVYVSEYSSIKLGGTARIENNGTGNLYLAGDDSLKLDSAHPLSEGAHIEVFSPSYPRVLMSSGADNSLLDYLFADAAPFAKLKCISGQLVLGTVSNAVAEVADYPSLKQLLSVMPKKHAGTIRLTADLDGEGDALNSITVPVNYIVTLDLNGHTMDLGLTEDSETKASVIVVQGTLMLTDSSEDETGKITGGYASFGGGVYASGTFTMNGGSIEGCSASSDGGGVDATFGTFNMTGGTIANCTASYGGGVYVSNDSTLNMTGGSITCCTASYGGGVYVHSDGIFNMTGGDITECTSTSSNDWGGGGVYVSGTFTMDGGSIEGCSAPSSEGGGVYVSVGMFNMSGGSIEDCTAYSGGGICVSNNSTLNMTGGSITGCTAYSGGGVCLRHNCTFNMTGGSITCCTASYGGGVCLRNNYTFNMTGGSITGCTASSGGGVCVSSGTFTMDGGSIEGCSASSNGGGVYVSGGATVLGGTAQITGNTSSNLFVSENAALSLSSETPLASGANIGITSSMTPTADTPVLLISSGATEDALNYLAADNADYTLSIKDGQLLLVIKTYTVTYDANGGENAPAAQTKTHGTALTLTSDKPTREGYDFLGWATTDDATEAEYAAGGSYTADADVTLYAVWSANSKIPIDIEIDEPPVSVGATITAPEGGWVEGENTFTVECEKACVLLVTNDGGKTYTRLKATAEESGYAFTADLTADSKIVCAVKGDISGDGRIRANEAKAVLKASAGESVTALQKQIADVNGDGKIRANEAKAILKASAGGSLSW